jgi:hypothetical protein
MKCTYEMTYMLITTNRFNVYDAFLHSFLVVNLFERFDFLIYKTEDSLFNFTFNLN